MYRPQFLILRGLKFFADARNEISEAPPSGIRFAPQAKPVSEQQADDSSKETAENGVFHFLTSVLSSIVGFLIGFWPNPLNN